MRKTLRWGNLVFAMVFFLSMFIPSLFSDKTGGEVSPEENRYLAKAPELFSGRSISWRDGEVLREIEAWINDNTFGRDAARRFLSDSDIKLFHERLNGQTLLAKDDWLFLWRNDLPDRAQHLEKLDGEDMDLLREKAVSISRALEERNAAFCATIFPHKVEMCSMYLSDEIRVADQPDTSEQLLLKFGDLEGFPVWSCHDELKKSMTAYSEGNGPLTYYKAHDGSHWNWRGAFIGYQTMGQALKSVWPELKTLQEKDFVITPSSVETQAYGRTIVEEDTVWQRKESRKSTRADQILSSMDLPLQDPWKVNRAYINEENPDAPRAVIVGDSYLWMFFLDDLADSFSEMVYINVEDAACLFDIVDRFNPDVVAYAGIRLQSFIDLVRLPE